MTRILVVDDEPQLLRTLRINLRARGYDVDVAADGATALRAPLATPRRRWPSASDSTRWTLPLGSSGPTMAARYG
jgi:hypothetical protein